MVEYLRILGWDQLNKQTEVTNTFLQYCWKTLKMIYASCINVKEGVKIYAKLIDNWGEK